MAESKKNKTAEAVETVEAKVEETKATEVEETPKTPKAPEKPLKPTKKLVSVRIPRDPVNNTDSVFVGVNFKNYILKRGTTVQVPEEVAEVLYNAELAEDAADAFAKAKEEAFNQKTKELAKG